MDRHEQVLRTNLAMAEAMSERFSETATGREWSIVARSLRSLLEGEKPLESKKDDWGKVRTA